MTKETHQPLYSEGEILVYFKVPVTDNFAATFGQCLGYQLAGSWEHGVNVFIYQTTPQEEEKAINVFLEKAEFVESAFRRDIGLERRWQSLEEAIGELEELLGDCEIPEGEYQQRLREIKRKLR